MVKDNSKTNETEVTIITSFFDVGRGNFAGEFNRTNEKYISFFEFWAKIKNKLIVYTDSSTAKRVIDIRKKYGLEEKTHIEIIDDYSKIAPDILNRMRQVAKNDEFLKFRYAPNPADNNADYDYIMLLKSWCLYDSVQKNLASGMLCWLDFGFNHGGRFYPNSDEFDFTLKVDMPKDKITFFGLKQDDGTPVFKLIENYDTYFMGFLMYLDASLASILWKDMEEAMYSLTDMGFIDDDQTLMLMVTRRYKERYNVILSDWLLPIKEYGGEHLTFTKPIPPKGSIKDRLLKNYRIYVRNKRCMNNLKSLFWQGRN